MTIVHGLNRQQYQLDSQPFSKGGEGEIYNIYNHPNRVAKIYHPDRISQELESKLKIMVARSPSQAVLSQVAWPLDVVYDTSGQFCGFIMPKLDIDDALRELYEYPPQKYKNVSISQKICIAQNICAVISEVHRAGYVFGDFNPLNIGVNLTSGKVAFLDTDSYHTYDQTTGSTYRCKVCLDGYVAPELLAACENYPKDAYASAPLPTFTKETDNFALAIHIFKLLMNGYTPYNGIPETVQGSTASPGVGNNAIKRDSYCFKPGNKPQAVAVPPLEVLPDEIVDLFTRAFMLGKVNPKQRPDAVEWHTALGRYEQSLQTCHRNSAHQYRNGISICPWCEADQRYTNAVAPKISQKQFSTPVPPPGKIIIPSGTSGHTSSGPSTPVAVPVNSSRKVIGFIVALTIMLLFAFYVFSSSNPGIWAASPTPTVDLRPSPDEAWKLALNEFTEIQKNPLPFFLIEDKGLVNFSDVPLLVNQCQEAQEAAMNRMQDCNELIAINYSLTNKSSNTILMISPKVSIGVWSGIQGYFIPGVSLNGVYKLLPDQQTNIYIMDYNGQTLTAGISDVREKELSTIVFTVNGKDISISIGDK